MTSADDSPKPPASGYVKLAAVALVFGAVGTFLGNWAWNAYAAQRVAHDKAEVERLAAEEAKSPKGRQRAAVARDLLDGSSAVFRDDKPTSHDPLIWCGYVNAKNRMGAMVGFKAYIVELQKDPARSDFDLVEIEDPSAKQWEKDSFAQRRLAICR